jgi:hypothetical protein
MIIHRFSEDPVIASYQQARRPAPAPGAMKFLAGKTGKNEVAIKKILAEGWKSMCNWASGIRDLDTIERYLTPVCATSSALQRKTISRQDACTVYGQHHRSGWTPATYGGYRRLEQSHQPQRDWIWPRSFTPALSPSSTPTLP